MDIDFEDALQSAFGWEGGAETQNALDALFPAGAPDAGAGARILRSATMAADLGGLFPAEPAAGAWGAAARPGTGMASPFAGASPSLVLGAAGPAAAPVAVPAPTLARGAPPPPAPAARPSPPAAAAPAAARRGAPSAAAAAAAAAQAEAAAEFVAPRRRGRPPVRGMVYSREYLAVKKYRQRKRALVSQAGASPAPPQRASPRAASCRLRAPLQGASPSQLCSKAYLTAASPPPVTPSVDA
jgi:hypothetical protein